MALTSGISVFGYQVLQDAASAPQQLMSIRTPAFPLNPVRRLGYWWLYTYDSAVARQLYVVEEGVLRSPGTFIRLRMPAFAPSWRFMLEAEWSSPGIEWLNNII